MLTLKCWNRHDLWISRSSSSFFNPAPSWMSRRSLRWSSLPGRSLWASWWGNLTGSISTLRRLWVQAPPPLARPAPHARNRWVCLVWHRFKGGSSPQTEISPDCYSTLDWWRPWWHFQIPRNCSGMSQREWIPPNKHLFYPMHSNIKQTTQENYCLCGAVQMSRRHGSLIWLSIPTLPLCFWPKYPLQPRSQKWKSNTASSPSPRFLLSCALSRLIYLCISSSHCSLSKVASTPPSRSVETGGYVMFSCERSS